MLGFNRKKDEEVEESTQNTVNPEPAEPSITIDDGNENATAETTDAPVILKEERDIPDADEESKPLTEKDMKNLRRNHYIEKMGTYKKAFVLHNKKTNQYAEIRAVSSLHACNMIGWRKKNVRLVEIRDVIELPENETVRSSSD